MPEVRTGIVVLAAGDGSRFGGPKQLARIDGTPMLTIVLCAALDAASLLASRGARVPVRCVLGARADEVRAAVPDGVEVLVNHGWREGVASSLRVAVDDAATDPALSAVSVVLGDQPLVGAAAHAHLDAAHRHGASFAVATYEGRRGHPVLLARHLWPEVLELRGESGARVLMSTHEVTDVPCDGTGVPDDVDDPETLTALAPLVAAALPASSEDGRDV